MADCNQAGNRPGRLGMCSILDNEATTDDIITVVLLKMAVLCLILQHQTIKSRACKLHSNL